MLMRTYRPSRGVVLRVPKDVQTSSNFDHLIKAAVSLKNKSKRKRNNNVLVDGKLEFEKEKGVEGEGGPSEEVRIVVHRTSLWIMIMMIAVVLIVLMVVIICSII